MTRTTGRIIAALLLAAAGPAAGQQDPPAWTRPAAPFRIVGDVYYVGSKGLAAYLIRTRAGAILIDGTLEANVPGIERNIASLGVPLGAVKVLLNSHAHSDHAGGLARLKADTGATIEAMDADRQALETGMPPSIVSYGVVKFPVVKVDRVLHDGDTVRLDGVTLTAVKTAGHTPGCTTWTMPVVERGRTLRVVFPCSLTVAGNKLVGNTGYPGIVGDYRASFARLARIRADVVLTAHPEIAGVMERHARVLAGERDAFVDPRLLPRIVAEAKAAFDAELMKQQRIM